MHVDLYRESIASAHHECNICFSCVSIFYVFYIILFNFDKFDKTHRILVPIWLVIPLLRGPWDDRLVLLHYSTIHTRTSSCLQNVRIRGESWNINSIFLETGGRIYSATVKIWFQLRACPKFNENWVTRRVRITRRNVYALRREMFTPKCFSLLFNISSILFFFKPYKLFMI